MNTLNSWITEEDKINWTPFNYQSKSEKSIKESGLQYSNRMKFSLVNSILHLLRTTIKISFVKHNKGRKSGYNTAVGLFLTNAIRGDYPNFEVNFSAVEISKGTLPGLDKWEFSVNDNELLLTWINEQNKPNAYADDVAHLVIFNTLKRSFIIIDTAQRADKSISCILPTSQKGDNVAWAFVINRDNSNSSNSHFLGKFEIEE